MSPTFSITRRFLVFLLLPTLVLLCAGAALSVLSANRTVDTLYDSTLQSGAELLAGFLLYEFHEHEADEEDDDDDDEEVDDDDDDSPEELTEDVLEVIHGLETRHRLSTNFRVRLGRQVLFSSSAISGLPSCEIGFSNLLSNSADTRIETDAEDSGDRWRCFRRAETLQGGNLAMSVEVFSRIDAREREVKQLLFSTFAPLLFLPILVGGLILWVSRSTVARISTLSDRIGDRSLNNLQPVEKSTAPTEFHPIIESVNGFMGQISQGLEREKRFTDDAAHELRTPITSIKMIEQLLRRELGKDSDPEVLIEQLNNLRSVTDQSHQLIEQLLLLARIQGSENVELKPTDLEFHCKKELGNLSSQITEKSLYVEFDSSLASVNVLANPEALGLLLNIVLANAIKFSERDQKIYLFILDGGADNLTLAIEDDGPGIGLDQRQKIFDRFYRAPSAKSKEGSGLGLSIARWLADTQSLLLSAVNPQRGTGAGMNITFKVPHNTNPDRSID
ncbi:MAG: HAMP domain-containing histidine kinase [Granulosicoccus sp.]|nr:HAMP domain-containing histidine kinase [Granulosicoccus sp.]